MASVLTVAVLNLHRDPTAIVRRISTIVVDTVNGALILRSIVVVTVLHRPQMERPIVSSPFTADGYAPLTIILERFIRRVITAVHHSPVHPMEPVMPQAHIAPFPTRTLRIRKEEADGCEASASS